MLDGELAHREVLRIPGREPAARRAYRGRDETVGLCESPPALGEVAPPFACLPPLDGAQWHDPKAGEEGASLRLLATSEASNRLLDVDGTGARCISGAPELGQSPPRIGATTEEVDQDRRVEENRSQLPDTALVGVPLIMNPAAGILVPLMTAVGDRAERRFEQLPAVVVIKGALDRVRDVCATPAGADSAVELPDDVVP
jgi:hypothetical protein